eukprot:4372015-Prorocentrum_lima.AAC.1
MWRLQQIGAELQPAGFPCLLGADWNMDPGSLRGSDWVENMQGTLHGTGEDACSSGQGAELDCCVASPYMAR